MRWSAVLENSPPGNSQLLGALAMLSFLSACATQHDGNLKSNFDVAEIGTSLSASEGNFQIEFPDKNSGRSFSESVTSPRCLAFIAKAEQDAALLYAPTLTASVDKKGDGQVALSYDLMNVRAAALNRKSAHARCAVTDFLDEATALRKLSARALAQQGALARVRYIDQRFARFESIRAELNEAVASDKITEKSRTKVIKVLSSLLERNDKLRGKARAQDIVDLSSFSSLLEVEEGLVGAIRYQFDLKLESDLSRNVRLTLSGGYSVQGEDEPNDNLDAEGFARASVSIRLGAFSPEWRSGKNEELEAELGKLYEPGTGALWRVEDTRAKNKIALSALQTQRSSVLQKLGLARKAQRTALQKNMTDSILSEIEIFKLRSELVEIETNLKVLREAQRLLSA